MKDLVIMPSEKNKKSKNIIEPNIYGRPKNVEGNIISCEMIVTEMTPIRDGKEITPSLNYEIIKGERIVEITDCNDGNYIIDGRPLNIKKQNENNSLDEWAITLDGAMRVAFEYLNGNR